MTDDISTHMAVTHVGLFATRPLMRPPTRAPAPSARPLAVHILPSPVREARKQLAHHNGKMAHHGKPE